MYLSGIGEIFLKGKNRINFERKLMRNIRQMLGLKPDELIRFRNRYLIKNDENIKKLKRVFGVTFYVNVIECKQEELKEKVLSLIKEEKSFRITAKKSATLKKDSLSLNDYLGSYVLENKKEIKVNLEKPEINIVVEDINNKFYIYKHSDMVKCFGGLPVGTGGFVQLRVNDEINSTVTGFLLMKRGCIVSISKEIPLIHKFESGFNIRIREEKPNDIVATDEIMENLEIKEDGKLILRPLLGYTEEQIKEIYNEIKEV